MAKRYAYDDETERRRETAGGLTAPEMPDAYGAAYERALTRYTEAEPFSYDYQSDPRWAAYKKQYTREGQRATEDTLGRVSAQTGGMPSTAAVTAAQQAGDYYAAQMTDKLPELYELAYAMYNGEQDRLYKNLSALRDARADELGRYGDVLAQWNRDRDYDYRAAQDALSQANHERDFDYRAQQDALDREADARDFNYRTERDARADAIADAELAARSGDYTGLAGLGVDTSNLGEKRWAYAADGGVYEIGTRKGLQFLSDAAPGQTMTGGDGSVWTKEPDGGVRIERNGRVWTIAGTPEPEPAAPEPEKPELTVAQVNAAIKNGVLTDKVLAAYEYYYGAPYEGVGVGSAGSGGGTNKSAAPAEAEEADGGAAETELPVDQASVLALGYGPISASRLAELVESGAVVKYAEGGRWRFRRAAAERAPDPLFTERLGARLG